MQEINTQSTSARVILSGSHSASLYNLIQLLLPRPPCQSRALRVEAATAGLLHEILVRLQCGLLFGLFLANLGEDDLAKDGAALDGVPEGGLLGVATAAAAAAARDADAGEGLGEPAGFDVLRGILQVVVVVVGAVAGLVAEAGDALLQLDGEDGLLELGAGLLGAAQLGKQVVLGGVFAAKPDVPQGFLGKRVGDLAYEG